MKQPLFAPPPPQRRIYGKAVFFFNLLTKYILENETLKVMAKKATVLETQKGIMSTYVCDYARMCLFVCLFP